MMAFAIRMIFTCAFILGCPETYYGPMVI